MEKNKSFVPGWYAVLPINKVKHKPVALQCFGESYVLWRDSKDRLICMLDHCPHRGAKLSLGKVRDNCIACPYHGFQFAADGSCSFSPEFDRALPGVAVKTLPVYEAAGMIWLAYGECVGEFNCQNFLALDKKFYGIYSQFASTWNSHISYCIENQLDFSHLPTVHKNTIGRHFKYPQQPQFVLEEDHFAISLQDGRPTLEFYFSNIWILHISENMKAVLFFVPLDAKHTKIYVRTYNKYLQLSITRPLLKFILNKSNAVILNQDRHVVESQGEMPSVLATNDVLMKNDHAIKHFRELWLKKLMGINL